MTSLPVFIVGNGPVQGVHLLECDPGLDSPPAVTVLHGDHGDPDDVHWIQADRAGRRTEVDGDWLPIYYYIEAVGPFTPADGLPGSSL